MKEFEEEKRNHVPAVTAVPMAALYVRGTEDAQRKACVDYAMARGYYVGPTYDDRAHAVRIKDRPGAAAMIEAAGTGGFRTVVVEGIECLSRSPMDALQLCLDLDRLGVELHTVRDGRVAVPSVLVAHLSALAGTRLMLERMQAGRRRAAVEGRLPRTPYGYRRDGAGRHCKDPETAGVVRHIFDRLAGGASCATVARELSDKDVPRPTSPPLHGAPQWTARRVAAIKQDRVYAGEVVWGRTTSSCDEVTGERSRHVVEPDRWIVSQRPDLAIVDRETWRKVAQSRRRKGKA